MHSFLKNNLGFVVFYLLVVFANIFFFYYFTSYKMVSKPLIMASLIGFYISSARPPSNLVTLALIAALLGDIFLMFPYDDFFLIGLVTFLIMQLLYLSIFVQEHHTVTSGKKIAILLLLLFSLTYMYYMWNTLDFLKIPVTFYTICITAMVISSITRKSTLPGYSSIVLGAILFMVSDFLLAWNKFLGSFFMADQLVLITYMVAQFCIVSGLIIQPNDMEAGNA